MKRLVLYAIVVFVVALYLIAGLLKSGSPMWGALFVVFGFVVIIFKADLSPSLRRYTNSLYKTAGLPPRSSKASPSGDELNRIKRNAFEQSYNSIQEFSEKELPKNDFPIEHQCHRTIGNYRRGIAHPFDTDIQRKSYAIIGKAGSGKTIQLIKWMQNDFDLRQSEMEPDKEHGFPSSIPVYIPLNNWNPDEDLSARIAYHLAHACSMQPQSWKELFNHSLLTLYCDGLDEVAPENRSRCLQALFEYNDSARVYFTCQKEVLDQLLLDKKLNSHFGVFELMDLEPDKVLTILHEQKDGPLLATLGEKILPHLDTPLLLNLFIATCSSLQQDNKEKLRKYTDQQLQEILYETYFRTRLEKNKKVDKYWAVRTMSYFINIAGNIPTNLFYLDKLQPAWLNASSLFNYYLLSRILSGTVLSIAMGFIIASPFELVSVGILASLVTVFLTYQLNKMKTSRPLPAYKTVPLFTLALLIVCGIFQGLVTCRSDKDMTLHGLFCWTDSLAGTTIGIFFGIFFGYRKNRQTVNTDIQPMDGFKPDWHESTRTGIKASFYLGSFIGAISILIRAVIPGSDFYRYLFPILAPVYNYLRHSLTYIPSVVIEYLTFFLFAFSVAFLSGLLVFLIMVVRGDPEKEDEKPYSPPYLNYGIKRSFRFSVQFGILSFLSFTAIYGSILVLTTHDQHRWIRATMIGIGIGILTLLWYGGLELIQYWVLRILLYAEGKFPLRFYAWSRKLHGCDLLLRKGAAFSFRHPSMLSYLKSLPKKTAPKPRQGPFPALVGKLSVAFILVMICFSLAKPFANRYFLSHYWQRPDETNFVIQSHQQILPLNNQSFVVLKDGILQLAVTGVIDVGTYTGLVGPQGTNIGFLGFPLDSLYNRVANMPHAALLTRRVHGNKTMKWSAPAYKRKRFLTGGNWEAEIPVQAGDTIEFIINDIEWQNNSGHFTVGLTLTSPGS